MQDWSGQAMSGLWKAGTSKAKTAVAGIGFWLFFFWGRGAGG